MIGVEFVKDRDGKKPAKKLRDAIEHKAFTHGLLTLACGDSTLRVSPPLVIDRALMDEGLGILEASITEAEAEGLD
jgi:4-aminobutyrate aminotransferase